MKTNKPNASLADALAQSDEDGSSVEFDPPRADIRAKPAELDLIGQIPDTGIREFIADLAKRHGVKYVETGLTAMARVFTHLSDKDIEPGRPDETEKLLIALKKAEVIDGGTMVELLGRYFDLLDREEAGDVEKPATEKAHRRFGQLKGKLRIGDDFNDPLPDDLLDLFEGADGHRRLKSRE